MKQYRLILPILAIILLVPGATPVSYEGAAAVSANFPDSGLYVATNAFPRNTMVEITNLGTGQITRAVITAGLDAPGLLAELSREAAEAVGLPSRSIGRIRIRAVSDPLAPSRTGEDLRRSGDPDYDPRAAVAQYNNSNPAPGSSYTDPALTSVPANMSALEKEIAQIRAEAEAARAEARAARAEASAAKADADAARAEASAAKAESGIALAEVRAARGGEPVKEAPPAQTVSPPPAPPPASSVNDGDIAKAVAEAEAAKKEAEAARKEAEIAKAEAEAAKKDAEAARKDAETAKTEAEAAKAALAAGAADGTINADELAKLRKEVEAARAEAEAAKKDAEIAKAEAEEAKKDAEIARTEAEAAKKDAETAKAEAEAAKNALADGTAEGTSNAEELARARAEAEAARAEAEAAKAEAEAAKAAAALASGATAEELARAKAEADAAREAAETARREAENAKTAAPPAYDYTLVPADERPPYGYTPGSSVPQIFSVPAVSKLEYGKYYLQIAASRDKAAVEWELTKLKYKYPMTILCVANTTFPYRILVGPVSQGEAGLLLKKLQSSGYSKAFLRKGDY